MLKNSFLRRNLALLLCLLLALSLAACQEDPEGSIVVHKDMDKLISQATQPTESESGSRVGAADIVAEVRQTEQYKTTIENDSLNVTVNVDAQVEVPQVDSLNVYRVQQKPFTQEFIDKVRQALLGDEPLYEGEAMMIKTKADWEQEIGLNVQQKMERETELRRMLANGESLPDGGPLVTEEVIAQELEFAQQEIDRLQVKYDAAPAELNPADYPFDGKIHKAADRSERYTEDDVNSWLASADAGSELYYGMTDGTGGAYAWLYAQNTDVWGNKLSYRKCSADWEYVPRPYATSTNLNWEADLPPEEGGIADDYWERQGITDPFLGENASMSLVLQDSTVLERIPGETTELTQEEALSQAGELLSELGLTDFVYTEGGRYAEYVPLNREQLWINTGPQHWRSCYILRYYRELNGVLIPQSSGMKQAQPGYNVRFWPGECVEVRVNDNGIVGFDYYAPVEITETVVDNAALKPFSEIRETFEKMLPIAMTKEEGTHMQADVDQVKLLYTRISERDSFDTGLIVPVWSFEGTWSVYTNGEKIPGYYISLLNINAIDGSVINGELGY